MKQKVTLIFFSILLSLPAGAFASEQYEHFARKVIELSLSTNWDYEKSYLSNLCNSNKRSLMKFPTAFKQMEEQWQKGREDGASLKVAEVVKSEKPSGMGVQVDVKAQDEGSKEKATYRLWIETEDDGSLCLNGFNFF
jgi:hypothetical protein